jgi:hypothetical protein
MLIRRPAVRPPTGARMPTFERAFAELGSLGDVGGVRLVPGGGGGSGPHARAGLCCSDQEHPGALGNVIISMLGVTAVALFFSTLTRSAIGAALGTMGVLVASTVLLGLDAASHCIHSCPRTTGSRSSIPSAIRSCGATWCAGSLFNSAIWPCSHWLTGSTSAPKTSTTSNAHRWAPAARPHLARTSVPPPRPDGREGRRELPRTSGRCPGSRYLPHRQGGAVDGYDHLLAC